MHVKVERSGGEKLSGPPGLSLSQYMVEITCAAIVSVLLKCGYYMPVWAIFNTIGVWTAVMTYKPYALDPNFNLLC